MREVKNLVEKSVIPIISSKRRERRELRIPVAVVVTLSGLNGESPLEWASTENISVRGARILTTRSRNPNDCLLIKCAEGNLQARGKVVYRQCLRDNLFAIGVRLLAPRGKWGYSEVLPRNIMTLAG
jgi:PilZ domain-containing protein